MNKFNLAVKNLRSYEEGATAVEYAMLVALIAAVIILIVKVLGTQLIPGFTIVSGVL